MDITKHIPSGHSNGISREELCRKTGQNDRDNRDDIQNSEDLIINLQDGYGYFKPLKSEVFLVIKYYWQERKRALSILKRLSKIKRWLRMHREYEQIRIDEVS
jgi:hypothetical protein